MTHNSVDPSVREFLKTNVLGKKCVRIEFRPDGWVRYVFEGKYDPSIGPSEGAPLEVLE